MRLGPQTAGTPFSASQPAILWPSVACSQDISTSNSSAMRMAVAMSSALWAWARSGISRLSTGSSASSLTSLSGIFSGSSLNRSFFSM